MYGKIDPRDWPADAPVQPLGNNQGWYFFRDSGGAVRSLYCGRMGRTCILSLFGGDDTWLRSRWPNRRGGWDSRTAMSALIAAGSSKGLVDAHSVGLSYPLQHGRGAPITFREYIQQRKVTDDAPGDFVADARHDQLLPAIRAWRELRAHLERQGAIPEAIDAARTVWQGYRSKLGRDALT